MVSLALDSLLLFLVEDEIGASGTGNTSDNGYFVRMLQKITKTTEEDP